MMNKKLELISGDKMAILNTTLAPNKTVPGSYEIEGTVPSQKFGWEDKPLKNGGKPALERLTMARVRLLLNKPFFGNLVTRLKLEEAKWCPTAGTDGRKFYYNADFVDRLDDNEVLFLCGHEVLHCVYDHFGARADYDYDHQLYNAAGDYVINIQLTEDGFTPITTVKILLDWKYQGLTSHEVYEQLKEKFKCREPQNGELDTLDDHMGPGSGFGEGEDGKEEGGFATGDKEGEEGGGQGQGSGKPGPLTDEEKQQIKDELKEAIISAADNAGAGNCPAGIERMIKEWTEPKMNWRDLIRCQIESSIKSDYTFMRPSRKSQQTNAIIPGMNNGELLEVDLAIDLSGSISHEQQRDFFSEIKGIMEQYLDFRIRVWCFDTEVYNMQEFTQDNLDDFMNYEAIGGGGTEFMCNWEYMKENDICPEQFVMFTDGYPCGAWGDPDYCDTVFIIHDNQRAEAPFGITAHYEE
jgi:predicted metal-dependent peptidase